MPKNNKIDRARWVCALIEDFLNTPGENNLLEDSDERAWADPLVGFSRGDDPLFMEFKKHVGPFHWTPVDIFSKIFPQINAEPSELCVISWVLPQTEQTRMDNRKQTRLPCLRWARSRVFGEKINDNLKKHIVSKLSKEGFETVSPSLCPDFTWQSSDTYGFASNWSERHIAHACGLGTFGLCDGLITPYGKAMRAGSVITKMHIPPSSRPYLKHNEYCLYYTHGACKKCIERCPAGAITEAGHDKVKCFEFLASEAAEYVKTRYGFDGYGCGLCQTGVPCESGIPGR